MLLSEKNVRVTSQKTVNEALNEMVVYLKKKTDALEKMQKYHLKDQAARETLKKTLKGKILDQIKKTNVYKEHKDEKYAKNAEEELFTT